MMLGKVQSSSVQSQRVTILKPVYESSSQNWRPVAHVHNWNGHASWLWGAKLPPESEWHHNHQGSSWCRKEGLPNSSPCESCFTGDDKWPIRPQWLDPYFHRFYSSSESTVNNGGAGVSVPHRWTILSWTFQTITYETMRLEWTAVKSTTKYCFLQRLQICFVGCPTPKEMFSKCRTPRKLSTVFQYCHPSHSSLILC